MAKSSSAPRLADRGLAPLAPPARAMAPRLLRLREGCRVSRAAGRGKKKGGSPFFLPPALQTRCGTRRGGARRKGGPPRPQSRLGNRPRSAQERHLETVTGEHDELSLEPHALDTLASTTRNTLHDPDAELRRMTSVQTSGPRNLDPELNKALASKSMEIHGRRELTEPLCPAGKCRRKQLHPSTLRHGDAADTPYSECLSQTRQSPLSPSSRIRMVFRLPAPQPPKLPLILPTHPHLIPGPLAPLPEATNAFPPDQTPTADRAVFRPVVLLAGAVPADHTVRPLVRVLLSLLVALVARVHLQAAAEAEPAVALRVVAAAPAFWELAAGRQSERLALAPGPWPRGCAGRGDAEELD
ncbi:unnamed protein product [Diplocarpon coronariae]